TRVPESAYRWLRAVEPEGSRAPRDWRANDERRKKCFEARWNDTSWTLCGGRGGAVYLYTACERVWHHTEHRFISDLVGGVADQSGGCTRNRLPGSRRNSCPASLASLISHEKAHKSQKMIFLCDLCAFLWP